MSFKKLISLIFISLLFCSCELLFKHEEFSFKRENNNGNQLKMNGYYYEQLTDSVIFTRFLNTNGTVCSPGSIKINKKNYDNLYRDGAFNKKVNNIRFCWGIFKIKKDSIIIEEWLVADGLKPVFINKGKILNDTTFVITKSISKKGGEKSVKEVHHFKKFSPKMDSITKFIK
jgi:hypothetical protein